MTQDEIIERARWAGMRLDKHNGGFVDASEIKRFANLVAQQAQAEEREACAKVCEEVYKAGRVHGAQDCATAIRAKGENK